MMLENDNSVLKNDALESDLKGLIEALESMHNKFIEAGVEHYYLTHTKLEEVFNLEGYFTHRIGFYYVPRVVIVDKHSNNSIYFPIVIEKKNVEIFNCEDKAKRHAYWCVGKHRLFDYGMLIRKAINDFSETAYNELADTICEALHNSLKEKNDFIEFKQILGISYNFKSIGIEIDATYKKKAIFSFKADLERLTNRKSNYHFLNLMEKVARELNITIEAHTDFNTLFKVGIEYIDKINTALNLAHNQLMDYLVYKFKHGIL